MTAPIVEWLRVYTAAIAGEPTDLKVGPRMCADAMSEAATLIEKLGEALTKAEPFLESDYEAAKEACDADWEGMSFEALSSVREALSLISGEGVR